MSLGTVGAVANQVLSGIDLANSLANKADAVAQKDTDQKTNAIDAEADHISNRTKEIDNSIKQS